MADHIHMFDLQLTVTDSGQICSVEWKSAHLRRTFRETASLFAVGENLFTLTGITPQEESGIFQLRGERFLFDRLHLSGSCCYLIRRWNCRQELLKAALDAVPEGVQIYDAYANLVYLNKVSRVMSGLEGMEVTGRHLMDLYPSVQKEYSTTLTALQTRKPVYYRFDDYTNLNGKRIAAVNTAFPLMAGSALLGAVVFEQNVAVLQDRMHQLERMKAALLEHNASAPAQRRGNYTFADVIGSSEPLRQALQMAERVSLRDGNILLVGETGTGKEIFAQGIHAASPRKDQKFVSINCAAIPETLIEGMLFGTTKGAFTGSVEKAGLLEEANNGTLFLDELNSMSLAMQSKILRVLQEGTFRRVGSNREIRTNARIISACNEDPYRLMEDNRLRQDLFYRIATIVIRLPSLRERVEDIPELADYHLRESASRYATGIQHLASETLEILQQYSWPGNVRELFHALDYAMNVSTGEMLMPEHLPVNILDAIRQEPASEVPQAPSAAAPLDGTLQELMDSYECHILQQALQSCCGNVSKTAALLGIKRQSLQYRIRKYNIIV